MTPKPETEGIPPKGSGRPRGRISREIEKLPIGGRAAFRDASQSSVAGIAFYWGEKLKRKYVTRLEPGKIVAVWREA